MIFLTVGSTPFERLVTAMDALVATGLVSQPVFGQIAAPTVPAKHFPAVPWLSREDFQERMASSAVIVSHAGMGTILSAVALGKPLLVIPRLKRFNEIVNNHQVEAARACARRGLVLLAEREWDLPHGLDRLRRFHPRVRASQLADLVRAVAEFLRDGRGDG